MQLKHKPSNFEGLPASGDATPQRIKRFFKSALWFALSIGIGLVTVRLILSFPGPETSSSSFTALLLSIPVAFLLAYYITILIHELGHVIAAWLVDFQFVGLIVGPIKVWKNTDGLTVSYSGFKAGQLQGRALSVPSDAHNLKRRLLWMFVGGPLATLLQLLVISLIGVLMNGLTVPYFVGHLITALNFSSTLILLFTILPYNRQGIYSDGLRIWILLFDESRAEFMVGFHRIVVASMSGTRLGDLNLEPLLNIIDEIKVPQDKLSIRLLHYRHILDQDDEEQAAMTLNECLDLLGHLPNTLIAVFVYAEAAYYEARYNQDALTGDMWLELAETIYEKNQWLGNEHILKRAESAVLLAEGDREGAYLSAQEALSLLELCPDPGYVQSERTWLTQLAEEGEPPPEDSIVATRNEYRPASSSWLITKSFTGTLLRFGVFCLVGLLIGFGSILTKSTRYQLIADYYAWTDNYSTAIYYYNQGLEVADTDQDLARLYSHRGMAYHHQDQAILAVNDLTQAIELSPRGRYYLYRGIVYYQHEDYDVATIDLSESLTLELDEDERIRALFFRASAYVELKAYDLAIEDYETLLTLRLSTRERTRAQTSLNYIQQLGFE